jgi:hypothetical protein
MLFQHDRAHPKIKAAFLLSIPDFNSAFHQGVLGTKLLRGIARNHRARFDCQSRAVATHRHPALKCSSESSFKRSICQNFHRDRLIASQKVNPGEILRHVAKGMRRQSGIPDVQGNKGHFAGSICYDPTADIFKLAAARFCILRMEQKLIGGQDRGVK